MIASAVLGLLQKNKAQGAQDAQNKVAEEEALRSSVLGKRAMQQQEASSVGLQGMDARQAAFGRQQQYFDSVVNKYRVGGGMQ
jgi:hypothetical protein